MSRFVSSSFLALVLWTAPAVASAAEYKCKGDAVEKGGSTKYRVKTSGADYTVEKGGSTVGKVKKSGSKYTVEVGGRTVGTIEDGKIKQGGATKWTVRDAQKEWDCPDTVAAALYLLDREGKL